MDAPDFAGGVVEAVAESLSFALELFTSDFSAGGVIVGSSAEPAINSALMSWRRIGPADVVARWIDVGVLEFLAVVAMGGVSAPVGGAARYSINTDVPAIVNNVTSRRNRSSGANESCTLLSETVNKSEFGSSDETGGFRSARIVMPGCANNCGDGAGDVD